ncbi:MAG: TolC family protein [Treponemataceae bacterium]|nr:TolC family protein [Treponemataceae bacterium]MDE7392384.1 TolC family protein [Treponemataceae bacterium]
MRKSVLLALAVACAAHIPAQTAHDGRVALSLADAVDMALERNVTIARNTISLDANERTKSHAWNSISPSASVSGGLSIPDGIGDSGSPSDYTAELSGAISLSFSPNLFTSIKSARISYEQGVVSYEQTCRTVELNVREAFYGLLYEKENITLQERNLQTAKDQYEQNLAKYNQGRMSELDVLSAEVRYKSLQPTVENAHITFTNDLEAFAQLIGMDDGTAQIDLQGSLDDVQISGRVTLDGVEINAPAVVSLQKQLEKAQNDLLAARFSAYAPSVTARWSHGLSSRPANGERSTTDSGSLSLTATIPLDGLLPWSQRADGVASAQDTIADLELQLADARRSLAVSTQSSLRKISQSQSSLTARRANVELAQRTYDMTLQAYNRGTKDLLSLQNASDDLLSAQVSLMSEQRALISAVLALEHTIGVPFGTLSDKK